MTMTAQDGQNRAPRSAGVARRVRGAMAEERLRQTDLCAQLGISQPTLSRRLAGVAPWGIDDMELLAELLHVSEAYLLGFTNDRTPDQMEGGSDDVRLLGLEPRTRWLTPSPAQRFLQPVEHVATVIEFPTWRRALEISMEATA